MEDEDEIPIEQFANVCELNLEEEEKKKNEFP